MAKTLEQLLSLSSIIANETRAGANTALRVGGLFSDIIYYLRDLDYADKDDIPSLDGYATEQWVLGKGYATTSDLDLKLDAVTFNELFEKVQLEDGTWAIKAKLGLFSDGFISAKGSNVGGTSSEGGAVALYQLNDVLADGTQVSGAQNGAVFVYDATIGKWKGVAQSEIVPNLTGYAKESWVLQQGFLTGITSALVTGALGYTPYDAANFTKANIKSTLGISDWALASSKPSYTTKEVAEDTNLYFTNARAVAALKSITDGLSGDITTLEGYFTDGVANSALKLSDNGSYTAWGQTFFTNGKPKSLSGALTDVTDITSSGTITTNKIVIGNGTIEWDEANKGFKVTGLYSTTYLSAKGANTNGSGSSGGGLITSLYRYADLGKTFADTNNDTFNAYTINKINTDLGSRISVLEGKATNVSFTQSLTSGTQIGTITIDGASKNIYAPTIPTDDINKGVTAYSWGNHASVGYLTSASSLAWGKITGTPNTLSGYGITDAYPLAGKGFLSFDANGRPVMANNQGYAAKNNSGVVEEILWMDSSNRVSIGGTISKEVNIYNSLTINGKVAIHEGNYTNYLYSKTSIDNLLGGYLPLSGGTIDGNLSIGSTDNTAYKYIRLHRSNKVLEITNSGDYGVLSLSGVAFSFNSNGAYWNSNTIIHSGNIGSQSVASAAKLTTARSIWGQSFDGTADITHGFRSMYTGSYNGEVAHSILNYYDNPYGLITRIYNDGVVSLQSQRETTNNEYFNLVLNPLGGNVGIGTTNPQYKLDVNGNLFAVRLKLNNICLECGQDGSASGCSSEINNFTDSLYIQLHSSLGISMCHGGGNVAVGMVSAQYKLDVNGVIHSNTGIYSDGYVSAKGQNTSSDMRLKNVLNDVVLSVKDIANAPSMRFSWKNGGGVDVGSSAQYWQKLLPDAVKERDGMLEMQYANIALLSAIAIAKKVETHEERIERLERENKELRNEINMMKYGA